MFVNFVSAQHMPLNLIVNLDVPDSIILSRISDRWVHLPSGRVYNMSYNRPKVDGLDDETGEPLTKRPDDNPVRILTLQFGLLSLIPLMYGFTGNFCPPLGPILLLDVSIAFILCGPR